MTARNELLRPLDPDQLEREKEEWIKRQVEYLLSPGQSCDPLTAENVHESIREMDIANKNLFAIYVKHATEEGVDVFTHNHVVLSDFIVINNREYWQKMAKFLANKEWDEKIS